MSYSIVFSPEAQEQLVELWRYIARAACPETASRYTDAIMSYCESLSTFPHRGTMRDDVRPGLRVTNYKGRTVIAFGVSGNTVSIFGIFYGGQDYEAALQDEIGDRSNH